MREWIACSTFNNTLVPCSLPLVTLLQVQGLCVLLPFAACINFSCTHDLALTLCTSAPQHPLVRQTASSFLGPKTS